MASWIKTKAEPLYEQKQQIQFLNDRRLRICKSCRLEYAVIPPVFFCPKCGQKGMRKFDRMTIMAGRRFGKTKFGSIAGVEEAFIPDTIGWACAPTNPKLHRYVIPAFQQLIEPEWVADWDGVLLDLRLKNGSLIHFQTLDDPDQGRGQGLDWLWIDEICELTQKHWEVISPSLGDRRGLAYTTTSPRGYDWVYDDFFVPAIKQTPGYWALKARTDQNPKFQDEEGREFLERERKRLSPEMYKQEYEGDFVTFEGAVYGEAFKDSVHVLRTLDQIRRIVPEWPDLRGYQSIVGIDTGADHPFGGVKMISTPKGLVVVAEYLRRHKTFVEHAFALRQMSPDPKTWFAINKNERQPMIELAQHGIYCKAAQNDLVAGVERVKSWLYANQLFFVEATCPNSIHQMKSYRWADNYSPKDGSTKVKEKVFKKNDELPDCIRYACMVWPQLPKEIEREDTYRDISHFPGEAQATIRRMRQIEKTMSEKQSVVEGIGDFFL